VGQQLGVHGGHPHKERGRTLGLEKALPHGPWGELAKLDLGAVV
jgi:hypothetical protein